jgi:hypothetical protein
LTRPQGAGYAASCFVAVPAASRSLWRCNPRRTLRDDLVIAAADERDLAMVFTGMRHFRH